MVLNKQCELLGPFAIMVQGIMGMLAISSLVFKRYTEHPRRAFLIWFFDVSKQGFGALMIHFFNIFISGESGRENEKYSNPCLWYLLNLLLDTTLGVFILYIIIDIMNKVLKNHKYSQLADSGNYGTPIQFSIYLKQLGLFLMSLIIMKILIYIIISLFPYILYLGHLVLSPLERLNDSRYQIVLVMMILPTILNILQFCLVDCIIMGNNEKIIDSNHSSPAILPLLISNELPSPDEVDFKLDSPMLNDSSKS